MFTGNDLDISNLQLGVLYAVRILNGFQSSFVGINNLLAGSQGDVDALKVIIRAQQQCFQVNLLPLKDGDELVHDLSGQKHFQWATLWLIVIIQPKFHLIPGKLLNVPLLEAPSTANAVLIQTGGALESTAQTYNGCSSTTSQAALIPGSDAKKPTTHIIASEDHGAQTWSVEE